MKRLIIFIINFFKMLFCKPTDDIIIDINLITDNKNNLITDNKNKTI